MPSDGSHTACLLIAHTRLAHPPPPQVESFLHGPQRKATFAFFKDMHHAQAWAANFDHGKTRRTSHSSGRGVIFYTYSSSPMFCCYSAAVALGPSGGKGEGGSVWVKSKDWLQERREQQGSLLGELAQVTRLWW